MSQEIAKPQAVSASPRVLTNVRGLPSNPYLRLWNEAAARSGAVIAPISTANVLGTRAGRPDWVHLQWPERVLQFDRAKTAVGRLVKLLAFVAVARARGARVLLTVHNVVAHDRGHPRLERLLWTALAGLVTDVHLLSTVGGEEFFDRHPGFRRARRHVIPHGDYGPVTVGAPPRAGARAALGLPHDARVLCTFGLLKAYKGVEDLLDAFRVVEDYQMRLVVAGEVADPQLGVTLEAAAAGDPRIVFVPGPLDDQALAQVIRASDHVVLPYRRVLNSGSAMLALTLGRPVLLPRTPTFEELGRRAGPGWVNFSDGDLSPEDLVALPFSEPPASVDLTWCSWDRIAELQSALWRGASVGSARGS